MPKNIIKLASAEGRTFALGQTVVAAGELDGSKTTGRIVGFARSVDGRLTIAKVRVGRTLVRALLQDLEPAPEPPHAEKPEPDRLGPALARTLNRFFTP